MSASSEVAYLARALKAPRVAQLASSLAERARAGRGDGDRQSGAVSRSYG